MSDAEITTSTNPERDDTHMGADDDVLSSRGTVESATGDIIDASTEPNPASPVEPNPVDPIEPNPVNPTEPNPADPTEPNPISPVALNAALA